MSEQAHRDAAAGIDRPWPAVTAEAVAEAVAGYGFSPGEALVEELQAGHINDSLRVRQAGRDLLLQRINAHVFEDPFRLMENVHKVTAHLRASLADDPAARLTALELEPTTTGRRLFVDSSGAVWRAYRYLDGTRTHQLPDSPQIAYEAAAAYGDFQRRLADLDPTELAETIPHFHDTPRRYRALDGAIAEDRVGRLREVRVEVDELLRHRALAPRLVELRASGELPLRVVHNDAKLTNVLFDSGSGEALCIVDLDTVMPGLAAFDYGDLVRSMSHRAPEDLGEGEVQVDRSLFVALTRGFLSTATQLTASERRYLFDGGLLLVLQQAVRFLADYLDGDRYFRVKRPQQNLDRTRMHLQLLASLLKCEKELRERVAAL